MKDPIEQINDQMIQLRDQGFTGQSQITFHWKDGALHRVDHNITHKEVKIYPQGPTLTLQSKDDIMDVGQ